MTGRRERRGGDENRMTDERPHVEIYTDGGCDPNPGPGGWGAVLRFQVPEGDAPAPGKGYTVTVRKGMATVTRELSGGERDTTNNRMELTAAIEALKALKRPCDVDFYTDSEYLRKGITAWIDQWVANNWRRGSDGKSQPVASADLWRELYTLSRQAGHAITWHWVKGHAGHTYNERAHDLASAAVPRPERQADPTATQVYLRIAGEGTKGAFGWAAGVVRGDDVEHLQGGHPDTTVNHFALRAALAVLSQIPATERVQFYTNNPFLHDGITRWVAGWRRQGWKKPERFRQEWQALDRLNQTRTIEWIRFRNEAAPEAFAALRTLAEEARQTARSKPVPPPAED
jgi:ribonuclease HI